MAQWMRLCGVALLSWAFFGLADGGASEPVPQPVLQPFTSKDGPASVKNCTPKALGAHPHPALLAACFYVPFLGKAEVWEVKDKPNRLLALYATRDFHDKLEESYRRVRKEGIGIDTFEVFFYSEGYADLEILGSWFDAEKGLATVYTHNDGKPMEYKVVFVIENGLWRVDDLILYDYLRHRAVHDRNRFNHPYDIPR